MNECKPLVGGGWGDPAAHVSGADALASDLERRGGAHGRAVGAYTRSLLSSTLALLMGLVWRVGVV